MGKNNSFNNYSKLFKPNEMEANIISYDFDDDGKQIIVKEKGAISKLLNVKDRLDLLGLNNKVYFYKDFKKSKNFILFFII